MKLEMRIAKRRFIEKVLIWIAWKLPRQLVMWTTVRLVSATTGQYGNTIVPELSAIDALKRWDTLDKEV